jgi:hypothetical protein
MFYSSVFVSGQWIQYYTDGDFSIFRKFPNVFDNRHMWEK